MPFDLQPKHLENDLIKLIPIEDSDFEALFQVASDPLIWEQHPNKYRYKREVFKEFFKAAIESGGAFKVMEKATNQIIGSSRYYDNTGINIAIGYTFLAKKFWGSTYNNALKYLMLKHAFEQFDEVIFHVGAYNIRSQKAIARIGGVKFDEQEIKYLGDQNTNRNFVYKILKSEWLKNYF